MGSGLGNGQIGLKGQREYVRIGSTPELEHVSRPVGQPLAALASAGVSSTWSPVSEQPCIFKRCKEYVVIIMKSMLFLTYAIESMV